MSRLHDDNRFASARTARRGVVVYSGLLTVLLAVGCSRGTPSAQSATEPTTTDAAQSAIKETIKPVVDDLSGHPPEDIFEVVESAPNFEVLGQSPALLPPDTTTFLATAPAEPTSATHFVVSANAASLQDSVAPVKLPNGFVAITNAELIGGLPTRIRCEADGTEFVLVPAGAFQMGSSDGPSNAQPIVQMLADAFYMGVTEVRVGQYADGRRRVATKGQVLGDPSNGTAPIDHPVLGVQWIDAKNYVTAIGCDLPTEAQWEKAARGSAGYSRPWGNSRPLWTAPRTLDQIDPVGLHDEDRSVYGVLDLAGNAWEWTADLYQEDAFKALFQVPLERRRNWAGPKSGAGTSQRVVKGGGTDWVVYFRRGLKMNDRHPQVGFRCVLNLPSK